MKIEAICATNGLHKEYLVRMSHKEVMAMGGSTFEPGDVLTVSHDLARIDTAITNLRYAQRYLKEVEEESSQHG